MIERKFIAQNMKEFRIEEYIAAGLKNVGHSHTKVQRTPLGEKIVIYASRPGLIVGRKGQNIKTLTKNLKIKFNLENPEIEISEVEDPRLDARIMSEKIVDSLEHFGTARFKGIAHIVMTEIMEAGALGVEIVISGKVPSTRAKRWRFSQGYIKKSGDVALTGVNIAYAAAKLKSGVIGIIVKIMPPQTKLPDAVKIKKEEQLLAEQPKVDEKKAEEPEKKKRPSKRKSQDQRQEKTGEKSEKRPRAKKVKKEDVKDEKTAPASEASA